jgi:hypothetical protein
MNSYPTPFPDSGTHKSTSCLWIHLFNGTTYCGASLTDSVSSRFLRVVACVQTSSCPWWSAAPVWTMLCGSICPSMDTGLCPPSGCYESGGCEHLRARFYEDEGVHSSGFLLRTVPARSPKALLAFEQPPFSTATAPFHSQAPHMFTSWLLCRMWLPRDFSCDFPHSP